MADTRNAKLLEILRGQAWKKFGVHRIVVEGALILPEAKVA
jgi:hypothetical protein